MSKLFKITLVLEPQKEGGWTVISPVLPELIAEVEDLSQIDEVIRDAMNAVIELYEDTGKEFPPGLIKAFKEQNLLFGSNPSSSQGNEL